MSTPVLCKLLVSVFGAGLLAAGASCAQADERLTVLGAEERALQRDISASLWSASWLQRDWDQLDARWSGMPAGGALQPLSFTLDVRSSGVHELGLSWATAVSRPGPTEEPLVFRVSLRGFSLYESRVDGDQPAELFSFDRVRDREVRKQIMSINLSKRF